MDFTLSVLTGAQVAAIVAVTVGILLLAAEAYFLYLLVRQNGRLVLRLDAFEQKLAAGGYVAAPNGAQAPAAPPQPVPEGLPVGTQAPAFALSGLFGETMTLPALRAAGKPVMLFFVDPGCGPCNALLPDIARWQREGANELTVALISRGTADENRAKTADHGLRNVLHQNEREVSAAYLVNATPSALVVAADGTIASPVAAGADQIQNLVAQWTRSAQYVPPAPAPIPALAPAPALVPAPALNGTAGSGRQAPTVQLPDLNGRMVDLSHFRGSPTAVLFWNPDCGFCQRMVDDLKNWENNPPPGAPKLLVVSTGTPDQNRAQGIRSTIVLDQGFSRGTAFGASGTPSAVLVDAQGNIASEVGVGAPGVYPLLGMPAQQEAPAPAPLPAAAIGQAAPTIALPDLNGRTLDISEFRGSPTAVLFWNPDCGFCQRMVDDLKNWENNPPPGAPKLLVVSTGSPEQNRAQGIRSPIVLDSGFSKGTVYGVSGTPSAVLVDADGRIASPVGVGAPGVFPLLGIAPPADTPAAPPAPAAAVGQPAPQVQLPDLSGRTVTLDEYRGQNTLVLFWNPDCGFCQRMLDDLKAWENNPPAGAPKLIVISTGTADQNRAQGIRSTIVLDQGFSRGTAFGVQGTPSAVLVDAQGNIASEVGVGAPAVLSLAGVAS